MKNAIKSNKKIALILLLLVVILIVSACNQKESRNSLETPNQDQTIPNQEESEVSESLPTPASQEQIENSDNIPQENNITAGAELFYISLSGDKSVDITLDIPESWSRDSESIFDENEKQIASLWTIVDDNTPQTYVPADSENPFAEAEEAIGAILNSPSHEARDFTVNDLPVRAYYYGTGEDGPDFLTDLHYAYFVFINGEVLKISFHTRIDDNIYSQADFDKIIDSFRVVS